MRNNNLFFIIGVCFFFFYFWGWNFTYGQDRLSVSSKSSFKAKRGKSYHEYDTVVVRDSFPKSFRGLQKNQVIDSIGVLDPIFERLKRMRNTDQQDTLRIVHIGDSHVRGHIFPQAMGKKLKQIFKAIDYVDMGVNGATCLTFTHPARIKGIVNKKPDLLILSLGTNESYNRSYRSNVNYRQMDELIRILRDSLPETPMILTTPAGHYERVSKGRRKSSYVVNVRVEAAAATILKYAEKNKLAVWDLYRIAGGNQWACRNWMEARMMRSDHVHFYAEGYVFQGELFYKAFIKAYNKYVVSH